MTGTAFFFGYLVAVMRWLGAAGEGGGILGGFGGEAGLLEEAEVAEPIEEAVLPGA